MVMLDIEATPDTDIVIQRTVTGLIDLIMDTHRHGHIQLIDTRVITMHTRHIGDIRITDITMHTVDGATNVL